MCDNFSPEILQYSFNRSNDSFHNFIKPYWLNKLPLILKVKTVDKSNEADKKKKVIVGYPEPGKPEFITELHPTASDYLFYGNDECNNPKFKSFILFCFQPDNQLLMCFFYNNITPTEEQKKTLIITAISCIEDQ